MEKAAENIKMNSDDKKSKSLTSSIIQSSFRKEALSLEVEEINYHFEKGIIERRILLAFKSDSAYMVACHFKGLKVVEDHKEVFSGKLPEFGGIIDLVYASHLDCFLFLIRNHIYRKDIDDQLPFLFIDLSSISIDQRFSSLVYSKINRRLIGRTSSQFIIIDVDKKRVDFIINRGRFFNFEVIGQKESGIISLVQRKYLSLLVISYQMRKILAFIQHKLDLIAERQERAVLFAVNDQNNLVLVELQAEDSYCSRMVLFEIKKNKFMKKAVLDVYTQRTGINYTLSCCGCFGDNILWIGLSHLSPVRVRLYACNAKTWDLMELEEKRTDQSVDRLIKVKGIRNGFYFVSKGGKLMRLTVRY